MDGINVFLVVLLGLVSGSHDLIFGSKLEVTVRPGDNITLHCNCKSSSGIFIVWFRNCSHKNQPPLVLRSHSMYDPSYFEPHLHLVKNQSSDSYDLLIVNITESDEGFYYCGTEQKKFSEEYVYRYGNVMTRILLNTSQYPDSSECRSRNVHCVSWMTVAFTPVLTIFSSLLSFILIYHICQKADKEAQVLYKNSDTRGQRRHNQDEDVILTRVVFWAQDG